MKTTLRIIIFLCCFLLSGADCFSGEPWKFKKSYESKQLTENPFFLITAADINKNGFKELIVTDFGKFGDHIEEWKEWRKDWNHYNLFVLEWDKGALKVTWNKEWDMTKTKTDIEAHRYFLAFEARQMVPWHIGNKVMVETIPPYLGLEWLKGKYILHEQQGPFNSEPLVGSWVFPWLSSACYQSFTPKILWPRECMVAVRDFFGNEKPMIVTIAEMTKDSSQILRVRRFENDFQIEKEHVIAPPLSFGWWMPGTHNLIDRLTWNVSNNLLMWGYKPPSQFSWYMFDNKDNKDYLLINLQMKDSIDIESYDLPDIYLRSTQKKGSEEYWGYRFSKATDEGNITLLRKVALKADLTSFNKDDIDFDHHKSFLGVGFFDLKDLDGDGLDEVILAEETGKREFGEETIYYSEIKDYIRILLTRQLNRTTYAA